MRDSLFFRMIGRTESPEQNTNERIGIHYLVGALSEYATGQYTIKHILDLWRPGITLERQLRSFLIRLDEESNLADKLALVQEWESVFVLAERGHDYTTEIRFNKRLRL